MKFWIALVVCIVLLQSGLACVHGENSKGKLYRKLTHGKLRKLGNCS